MPLLRTPCPDFLQYIKVCGWKIVQQLWMNCQFRKCFSFLMVIYYFRSMPTASTKCVNLEWRSWDRVSEARAHYPSQQTFSISFLFFYCSFIFPIQFYLFIYRSCEFCKRKVFLFCQLLTLYNVKYWFHKIVGVSYIL